ncbi:DUF4280 domain-containing protein [Enterobacteriaceae bacterium LUAb1]
MPCNAVCAGALMECSFAETKIPVPLEVLPLSRVNIGGKPAATIMSHAPFVNIPSFGLCMSELNPEVILATALALGVPTPAPCVPVVAEPWIPERPNITVGGLDILVKPSRVFCAWEGIISVKEPGQFTVGCGE